MIEIYTDGASRGNPGEAAIAVLILEDGKIIKEYSEAIGKATNNEAEYNAILKALDFGKQMKIRKIMLYSDSEIVVRQLNGKYKVKKEHLKELFNRVKEKEQAFEEVLYFNVKRENKIISKADKLCNETLDKLDQ